MTRGIQVATCNRCGKAFKPSPSQIRTYTWRCYACAYAMSKLPKIARPSMQERFWSKVDKTAINGCWIWTAHIDEWGYGRFAMPPRGQQKLVHRLSWTFTNGDIPSKLLVLHKCDTPACVNPSHLRLGTNADNMRDMVAKGRTTGGTFVLGLCKRGHSITGENILLISGAQRCRLCRNNYEAARRAMRMAAREQRA